MLQVYYLVTVFVVLEAGIIVHETVQLLKTFVLLLGLLSKINHVFIVYVHTYSTTRIITIKLGNVPVYV